MPIKFKAIHVLASSMMVCFLGVPLYAQTPTPTPATNSAATLQAATDKAAADKALADKALADKALVDEAAVEKLVAQKAAVDKLAADKKADEKALALYYEEPYVPPGGVHRYGLTVDPKKNPAEDPALRAGMNDIIVVQVKKLKNLLNKSKCRTDEDEPILNCKERSIVLYLDGREIKGLVPESGAPIPEDGTLRFHIQRTDASDEAWADLLGAPPILSSDDERGSLFIRPVKVSVGLTDDVAIRSDVDKFSFIRVHEWVFWFSFVGLLALVLAVVVLARKTSLLRDGVVPIGENRKGLQTDESPYSLGRCQMAFWFFLVIGSFLFIFLITWQFNTVTEQALALMGISAATALGAVIVTANKDSENQTDTNLQEAAIRYRLLKAEKEQLKSAIKQLRIANNPLTAAQLTDLNLMSTQLRQVKKKIRDLSTVSQGFLDDLLTDIHGYSFHRLQIFVWTVVLGLIFLHGVYYRLAMPKFSAALLALLGISGATYIGFKIPEQQEPAPTNPAQPAGNAGGGGGQGGKV